jgi:hypothetical protein
VSSETRRAVRVFPFRKFENSTFVLLYMAMLLKHEMRRRRTGVTGTVGSKTPAERRFILRSCLALGIVLLCVVAAFALKPVHVTTLSIAKAMAFLPRGARRERSGLFATVVKL